MDSWYVWGGERSMEGAGGPKTTYRMILKKIQNSKNSLLSTWLCMEWKCWKETVSLPIHFSQLIKEFSPQKSVRSSALPKIKQWFDRRSTSGIPCNSNLPIKHFPCTSSDSGKIAIIAWWSKSWMNLRAKSPLNKFFSCETAAVAAQIRTIGRAPWDIFNTCRSTGPPSTELFASSVRNSFAMLTSATSSMILALSCAIRFLEPVTAERGWSYGWRRTTADQLENQKHHAKLYAVRASNQDRTRGIQVSHGNAKAADIGNSEKMRWRIIDQDRMRLPASYWRTALSNLVDTRSQSQNDCWVEASSASIMCRMICDGEPCCW